jgi:hypothetical protein
MASEGAASSAMDNSAEALGIQKTPAQPEASAWAVQADFLDSC